MLAEEGNDDRCEQPGGDLRPLLTRLDSDEAQATSSYFQLRHKLISFLQARVGDEDIAADLVDDALLRVSVALAGGADVPDAKLKPYCYSTARNVWREYRRDSSRALPLEDWDESKEIKKKEQEVREREWEKLRRSCLLQCLGDLNPENNYLIKNYYKGRGKERSERRKKLAEDLGLKMNALHQRKLAIERKLKKCCERCIKKAIELR